MNKEDFENEKLYQITMSIFRAMKKEGLISEEEYAIIDTIMTEKYNPIFGVK